MIPSSSQRSPTTVPFFPIAAAASRTLAGVIFGLRPPLRPRARAAAKPARVLEHAQKMAAHASAKTTKLYDRRDDQVTLDEVERIVL